MSTTENIHSCCLTIAGSDSGGNAGVQADLRAFHSYGFHACTVFTALTAQNPFGVSAVHDVPAPFVASQLNAVLGTYSIAALKTGMLSNPSAIEVVAEKLKGCSDIKKVIDPVMIATSGAKLISDDAIAKLRSLLIPLATLITPNIPEALTLSPRDYSGSSLSGIELQTELAKALNGEYGVAALVKGGHGEGASAVDVLCDESGAIHTFTAQRIESPVSTHGTGCSMAAALAAELALGRALHEAVRGAKRYVFSAIESSYLVGPGCGVLGFVDS